MSFQQFKRRRLELGFTLRDVEQITELSNAYISQFENGKIKHPSAHAVLQLCAAYAVSFEDGLKWIGSPAKVTPPKLCSECGRALPLEYAIDEGPTP